MKYELLFLQGLIGTRKINPHIANILHKLLFSFTAGSIISVSQIAGSGISAFILNFAIASAILYIAPFLIKHSATNKSQEEFKKIPIIGEGITMFCIFILVTLFSPNVTEANTNLPTLCLINYFMLHLYVFLGGFSVKEKFKLFKLFSYVLFFIFLVVQAVLVLRNQHIIF